MNLLAVACLMFSFGTASAAAPEPAPDGWSLAVIGDTLPGGVYEEVIGRGLNPFRNLSAFLAGADVAVANLEGPLTARGTRLAGKQFTFRSAPGRAQMLRQAGISVVGLSNNHILDYGPVGLSDTTRALDAAGIQWCGAGDNLAQARKPAIREVRGTRVAFLSYNRTFPSKFWAEYRRPGTAFADAKFIREDVAAARAVAGRVVVLVHWGREKSYELREYQVEVARAAAEAGADLVVGTHPHIPQGVQVIGRTVVVYSIGDGVFGGSRTRNVASVVLRARFGAEGLRSVEFIPLETSNVKSLFAPKFQEGERARKTLDLVRDLSGELGTKLASAVSEEGLPTLRLELPPKPGAN
jgi:poly-gamma-glutamate synthesis protein (capsule biosynthesis protein)